MTALDQLDVAIARGEEEACRKYKAREQAMQARYNTLREVLWLAPADLPNPTRASVGDIDYYREDGVCAQVEWSIGVRTIKLICKQSSFNEEPWFLVVTDVTGTDGWGTELTSVLCEWREKCGNPSQPLYDHLRRQFDAAIRALYHHNH